MKIFAGGKSVGLGDGTKTVKPIVLIVNNVPGMGIQAKRVSFTVAWQRDPTFHPIPDFKGRRAMLSFNTPVHAVWIVSEIAHVGQELLRVLLK